MAKILFVSTCGSENPTKATLPWLSAKGAIEGGHQPQIVLAGDAAILANKTVAESVQGVGIPPLKELVAFAMEKNVPVFVWGMCGRARGVAEKDLEWLKSKFIAPKDLAQMMVDCDRTATF